MQYPRPPVTIPIQHGGHLTLDRPSSRYLSYLRLRPYRIYAMGQWSYIRIEARLTESRTYGKAGRVPREKEFPDRITLPLAAGVIDRLDALKTGDETRLDVIRKGIAAEIKRRERAKP